MNYRVVRVIWRPDLAMLFSPLDSRGWVTIIVLWSRDVDRWPAYLMEVA